MPTDQADDAFISSKNPLVGMLFRGGADVVTPADDRGEDSLLPLLPLPPLPSLPETIWEPVGRQHSRLKLPGSIGRFLAATDRASAGSVSPKAPLPVTPAQFDLPLDEGLRPTRPPLQGPARFQVLDQTAELEVTLRRSKLLQTTVDIYRTAVVDPSICDVIQFTPREVSILGRGQGATHVTFWFTDNQQPVTYLVKVAPDPAKRIELENIYKILERVIAELFPDSKVRLIPVADKLIVKGQAKGAEEAAQILSIIRREATGGGGAGSRGGGLRGGTAAFGIPGGLSLAEGAAAEVLSPAETGQRALPQVQVINMLRVPGVQQVALRVKIAELNRTAARGFGIDLDAAIDLTTKGASQLLLRSLINMATGEDGDGTSVLARVDGDDIDIGIRYLQQRGVLRILSEPTLVTLSGQPATFVSGGEFAVPTVVGVGGVSAVTTDFRSFGAIISFLPTVLDKDRIRLQVAPEFSEVNNELNVGGTPGINVRAVTTTVELREGQTLAIAGLLEDTMKSDSVSDIPFLARFFGRRDVTRNETELMILVTPELVHPMEPEEVPPLPGFDVTEPTAREFFLSGLIEGLPIREHRSTVWPRLRRRYRAGGPAMISGPFGHGQ